MKPIYLSTLLYVAGIICLCACTSRYPGALLQVETIVETEPDSALVVLESVKEQMQQESEATEMYYHLLLTETTDRCSSLNPADSLLPAVIRYYEAQGENEKLMKAYYYMGRVGADMNEVSSSFLYFLKALDVSGDTPDSTFLGQIHLQIGRSFVGLGYPEAAIREYQQAYTCYQQGEDSLKSVYALLDLAKAYDSMQVADSALYHYQKACQWANLLGDERAEVTALRRLTDFYLRSNESDEAFQTLQRSIGKWKEEEKPNYRIWGDYYRMIGKPDSATVYFEKELLNKDVYANKECYWKLYEIEKQQGNSEKGLAYLTKYVACSDSIYSTHQPEYIQRMKTLYDFYRIDSERRNLLKENRKQQLCIVGIMILTAIGTGLSIRYYQKKRAANEEQEKRLRTVYEEQYRTSRQYVDLNKKKIRELEERMELVQQEKDELHGRLLLAQKDKLEQTIGSIEALQREQALLKEALRKTDIYARCYRAIEDASIVLADKEWEQLKQAVNEAYDDFTGRLFLFYPSLTSMELHICLLLKIQIPVSTISQLVCRTQSAVSMSRKLLYKKIFHKEGSSALLDEFIVAF